jgi:hypothetical protein
MMSEITVDRLIFDILPEIKIKDSKINNKDYRILASFQRQLISGNFLTENQSKLLVKIFQENLSYLKTIKPEIDDLLKCQKWSQPFRVVSKIRRIFVQKSHPDKFFLHFTFDKRLKNKTMNLSGRIDGKITFEEGKFYVFSLTERNIQVVIDEFIKDDFEVDDKILGHFLEIKKYLIEFKNPLDVFGLHDKKLENIVESRVCSIDKNNLLKLHDKKHAFQYSVLEKIEDSDLTTAIAQRPGPKIYVDSKEVTLDSVLSSLTCLDRFPALVVFNGHENSSCKKSLIALDQALKKCNIAGDVGIYFRFDKQDDSCSFNNLVSTINFNKDLSEQTLIAGISNNKIPKFMLKMQWKPKTVITLTNNFRSNKSSVYFSDVDLVIFYNEKPPLTPDIHAIL